MPAIIQPHLVPVQGPDQGVQAQDQVQAQPQAGVNPAQIGQLQQQARQVIGQQPLRNLGPAISTAQQRMEQAAAQWAQSAPRRAIMPKTMVLLMPPHNNAVQIDSKMVEHEIQALPRNERQAAVENLPRVMQERVTNGHRIWSEVSAGNLQGPASMEDVRDLMTFLTAKGMEKGDGFSEGAFNIADPDHRVRNFLDSCPEMYQRPSSHIEGFQNAPGGGHRGIDAHNISLPYGKATLLYGSMNNGVNGLQGDRLFLKMEEHGCRLSSRWAPNRDPHLADRPARFKDLGQTLGHAMGFFRTVLRGISGGRLFANAPDSRKERIPGDVSRNFKAILTALDRSGQGEVAGILRQNDPLATAQGIRTMVANLDQALARDNLPQDTRASLQGLRDNLNARFDHLNVRIGNEVVLDQEELNGTSALASTTNLMRATINSLLSVADAESLTPDRVEHFAHQLAKAATNIDQLDADRSTALMGNALRAAAEHLSPAQREHLAALLNTPQLKGMMAGLLDVMAMGGQPLGAMDGPSLMVATSASRKMSQLYLLLCTTSGLGEPAIPHNATHQDMALVRPILKAAGNEAVLARHVRAADTTRTNQAQLAQQAVGMMNMGDARMLAGPGTLAVGQFIEAIPRGEVNREAIGTHLLTGIQEDLARTTPPDRIGLEGMPQQFIADFLRNGILVNGQFFGAQGTQIPMEEQRAHVRAFVDAVGGYEKAIQIARVVHQGRAADLLVSLMADPGYGPLQNAHTAMAGALHVPISPHTGRPSTMAFSILVEGDHASIQLESSSQRVPQDHDSPELGINSSVTFTLQGLGTANPAVRLDDWDALFSSTPRRRIADMDHANLQSTAPAIDSRVEAMMNGQPPIDRDAITAHLTQNLATELQRPKTPGYRGLPDEFIRDFFRRPMVVNGQTHGTHGGVDSFTEAERSEHLDAFIQAVGGENRARHIATMAYQNMPGLMDESMRSDAALGTMETAYLLHPAISLADYADFTITTQQDGSVDIHLDYRQQRGEADGYEFGKNGFLDFRLSNLDTGAPTVQLQRWDMHYGTNAPRR
ncbi:hypothetical protein MASR1M90_10530 [Desulfovibrionales bacterium]